ncbi:hypothetical protein [Subtercola lobariae]|uniref:Uncharacterized protein n=1 Tax=Subtercola lobariae TaxID=1588641 RepID=A0A917BAQ6_9MICO|nr:hypothetical protein [Subtercola lobariae]GGF34868.1 hypothetical protein GCM10011399_29930 [Subtercola lobariae]
MEIVIITLGCLGAWLLFAGPIYQAAIELSEQTDVREQFEVVSKAIPQPARVSPWWWLLPPAAYIIHQRREKEYQKRVMSSFTDQQRAEVLGFMSKATGWIIVAAGAFLIALKETWELTQLLDWSFAVFAAITVVAGVLSVLHTVLRMRLTGRVAAYTTDAPHADAARPDAATTDQ